MSRRSSCGCAHRNPSDRATVADAPWARRFDERETSLYIPPSRARSTGAPAHRRGVRVAYEQVQEQLQEWPLSTVAIVAGTAGIVAYLFGKATAPRS